MYFKISKRFQKTLINCKSTKEISKSRVKIISCENFTLCPNNGNVITKDQSQDGLLFDIIERIKDPKIKTQCLYKPKTKRLMLPDLGFKLITISQKLIFATMNVVSKIFSYLSNISNNKLFLEFPCLLKYILLLSISKESIFFGKKLDSNFLLP